jgi:hypothetical protein
MAVVDREASLEFLRTAFAADDWIAVFLKSYETGQIAQRVGPVEGVLGPRFQGWLRWRNLLRWNVYVSVNSVAPERGSRTRDAVSQIRHVFVEADHDGPEVLSRIAVRRDLPSPSYVLHSSPGRIHVFWKVTGFDADSVEALQKLLAVQLGTDPAATPCTQTTRVPGFFNHKRQPPHLVTVDYLDTNRAYMPSDFPRASSAPVLRPGRPVLLSLPGNRIERAARYLAAVPPAVSGQHGDLRTFQVCCRLTRGFALSDDEAFSLLADWNRGCEPPWCERDLRDKLRRARTYGREPVGGLLADAS